MILAAGRGRRMKSLTDDCPKPMLPLAGRPMLAHQLDRLATVGIERVCIVIGYRGEMIRDFFEAHPPSGIEVEYVVQEEPNGTGSAALLAREFGAGSSFLLTFGDILVDSQVYAKLYELATGSEIVLALTEVEDPYRGGAVYVEDGRVVRIVEKPPKGTSTTNYLCAGIYLFTERVFKALENLSPSPRGEYDLTDAINSTVRAGETVRAFAVPGFWRDVGRPEDLKPASDHLANS